MQNGGADLALDVVANDGQTGFSEAVAPIFGTGDEDRDGVDHAATGFENLFDVPLGSHLGTDGEVVDDHIGTGIF